MEWWNELGTLGQVFFCVAIASTVLLLIQSIFMFFGGGDGDSATDGGSDGSFDGEGLHLFSLRGIVAFFAMGGWTGVILTKTSAPAWLSIVVSVIVGAIALFAIALIMKALMKMQASGTMSLDDSIGKVATVYLRVPAHGKGNGKVNLAISGRYSEMDAVSMTDEEFTVGETVKVIGVLGDSLIVEKIETAKNEKKQVEEDKD